MDKLTYFLNALNAQAHHQRSWVLRAFSLFQEDPDSWKSSLEPFRLTLSPTGYAFVDPSSKDKLTPIDLPEGSVDLASRPLFHAFETVTAPAGFPFFPEGGITTYGNLLFNATVFSAVGNRLGVFNDYVDIGKIESKLPEILVDDPAPGETVPEGKLSISDHIRFCDAVGYLQEFTQLFTHALTEKAITPPTGLEQKKAEILEKYKDSLNDPLTQTKIYSELVAFDAEYLRGDPSELFLISAKSRNTVRRKLFLIQGAEAGLSNSQELPLITNSLVEGWQKESIPQIIDVLRAGSFDRGSETELGGVEAKWLMRSTSNVRVVEQDCGTKMGKYTKVLPHNVHKMVGRYYVANDQVVLIETAQDANKLVGQSVLLRAPHYCRLPHTDYCHICLGVKLSANKDGVSMAATARGGGFLSIFLGAMHAKVMESATLDLETTLT